MSNDDYDSRRRRENMMERRLRKARGEEVSDELELYEPYDEEDGVRPRSLGSGYQGYARPPAAYGPAGGGCGQALLFVGLGVLAAALIGALFFSQSMARFFEGVPRIPDVSTIIITPTPQIITGAAVVQRVQELSRLETASYTIQTVIDVRQSSNIPVVGDLLAGDELLLIAHGTVFAGVDLSNLSEEAVTVSPDGASVTLRLPPAQIFSTALDSQKTRVYSRERGIFAPDNKDLETLARQQAEQQILSAACEDGILSKATVQAEASLRQFLGLLDDVQVTVIPSSPGACVAPAAPVAPAATTPAP